ncbi:hypothetical protein PFLUV_G00013450 [Perca fluviatilis]|uniref:Uncharacterized protein n=1 Tax=Perca fluviatilis TaxID=8168 RepID=A0A6A5FSH6_PERFL|nr:hypothetical protein PFLUV_G00013450 [Perca fluviatilis]
MKTTTTTPIQQHTRHTPPTHPAPMVSLPQPEERWQVWRSPELSTRPPCRHDYCTRLLTITTFTIIISNSIMQRNSSKEPWSWTYMNKCYKHVQCNICRCPMPFPRCCPVTLSSCFPIQPTSLTTRPTSPHARIEIKID